MPALVKASAKKVTTKGVKLAPIASKKRKGALIEDVEVAAETNEHATKKLKEKGKSKEQRDKGPNAKKKLEAKGKGTTEEKKSIEPKPSSRSLLREKSMTRGSAKSKKAATSSPKSLEAENDEEEEVGNVEETGDEDEEQNREDDALEEDEEAPLQGFSSESDSSDEEDDDIDKAPIDVGKLPTIAKDDATVKRKLEKAKKQSAEDRGVLYLGRIPHGFYEEQMKAYFSQFGDVTRVRLSRNKKTGRSKHYAFIEFKSAAVAQIVAETMDNYLLMGHLMKCKIVPKEEVHPELWIGANRKFRKVPADRIERQHYNKLRTDEQRKKVERRLMKRQRQKKRKLEALGIDYDLEPVSYVKKAKQNA